MTHWVYLIAFIPAAYWLLITVVAVLSVRKMRHPEELLTRVQDTGRLDDPQGVSHWARSQDFELHDQFDFDGLIGGGGLKMAVECWYLAERNLFLMHYHLRNHSYSEFVTGLEGEHSLTTSNSVNSLSLPFPPGIFIQAFDGASLDRLRQEHEKTLAFFHAHFGVDPVAPDQPVRDLIIRSIKAQMSYIRSLPLWQLRVAWWHLSRRRSLRNQSVIQQIQEL
ncbi:hypothetical protein [Thiolapillus brandeum]|uniref:Uncharacterized protein n=1 Tax=Thiolapillus brandeum TaxID=1076588 RepID=A0A7U6GG34_9GAMM|nr:hypothetical protein [Thiolapillus brandeum]BAO42995.1 hypothetical protein TBH_C0046 [Thiolapillus brandeum]